MPLFTAAAWVVQRTFSNRQDIVEQIISVLLPHPPFSSVVLSFSSLYRVMRVPATSVYWGHVYQRAFPRASPSRSGWLSQKDFRQPPFNVSSESVPFQSVSSTPSPVSTTNEYTHPVFRLLLTKSLRCPQPTSVSQNVDGYPNQKELNE